jgi:hypothetical protein
MEYLISQLYDPVNELIEKKKDELFHETLKARKVTFEGAVFIYHPLLRFGKHNEQKRRIENTYIDVPNSLEWRVIEIRELEKTKDSEESMIRNFLYNVFMTAGNDRDIYLLLPEYMQKMMEERYMIPDQTPIMFPHTREHFIEQTQDIHQMIRQRQLANLLIQ